MAVDMLAGGDLARGQADGVAIFDDATPRCMFCKRDFMPLRYGLRRHHRPSMKMQGLPGCDGLQGHRHRVQRVQAYYGAVFVHRIGARMETGVNLALRAR